MARYTKDELYDIYVKNYNKRGEKTLMTKMFSKNEFNTVYDELKKAGINKNISREILNFQNILSRRRLKEAADKGLDVKKIRKQFKDLGFIQEKYGEMEFIDFGGTKNPFEESTDPSRQFSDAQIFFATLKDAGFTEEEAKEAYGY